MENTPLLEGLRVVDLASLIAGPAAATVLGDFGADVVKVEPPDVGDAYRAFSHIPPNPQVEGVNYTWQLDNRNKRSIELNLKSPDARAVLERLVQWADVLVTNFPPPTRAKLGLDYEKLASAQSPADLRRRHRLRRVRPGRGQARLRRHGVLGPQRPDGHDPPRHVHRRRSTSSGRATTPRRSACSPES